MIQSLPDDGWIDEILAKMNKCIEDGEGVDYDYYGKHVMADEPFSLADAKAAIQAHCAEAVREAYDNAIKLVAKQRPMILTTDDLNPFGDDPMADKAVAIRDQLRKEIISDLTAAQQGEKDV